MAAWASEAKDRAVAQWASGLAGTDEHFEYRVLTGKVDFQMVHTILVILINMVIFNLISSVGQFSRSVVFNSETPWAAAWQASLLSITGSQSILKLMSIELVIHPKISSSVVPFFSCLRSFLATGFFQWVISSHQVAKVLEFPLQHRSFQWIFRTDFL